MRRALLAAVLLLALVGPVAAQTTYEVFVHGIVQDGSGAAVKGGQVRLYRNDTAAGTLIRTATLTSNAWQFWEKLSAAEYSIIYLPPDGWTCEADEKVFLLPRDAGKYPPPPGTSADLVFVTQRTPATATPRPTAATPQATTLTVRCVEETAGIAGVIVTLTWGTTAVTRTTQGDGYAWLPLPGFDGTPLLLIARSPTHLCLGFTTPAGIEIGAVAGTTYAVDGTPVTPLPGACQVRVLSVAPDASALTVNMRSVATASPTWQVMATPTVIPTVLPPTATATVPKTGTYVPKTGTPTATPSVQSVTETATICIQQRHVERICLHFELFYTDGVVEWIEGDCVGGKP